MTVQERLTSPQKVLFKVADFLLLDESGAFQDFARTELIDGEILAVNAIHSRHAGAQAILHIRVAAALEGIGSPFRTYIAPSIPMGQDSVPEPDIVIGDPTDETFLAKEKARLLIEISDSTLEHDLGRKAFLYARNGIAEYWVADLQAKIVHQMWAPSGDGYAKKDKIPFDAPIAAKTIDRLIVDTRGLA